MSEIWVLVDTAQDKVRNVTYEVLAAASKLKEKNSSTICAVFIGESSGAIEADLGKYGAEKFYKVENAALKDFSPSLYATALSEIIKKHNPDIVLGGNTLKNQDYLPRVASRTGAGLAIDAIDIDISSESTLQVKRYKYSGKSIATVSFHDVKPMIATIRLNAFKPIEGSGSPEVISEAVDLPADDNYKVIETKIIPKELSLIHI